MGTDGWIGRTIGGRYRIDALLGRGGMSAVYEAYDPNLRRTIAIKLIHPHLATDPHMLARFKEEAAALARLRHPNIVQVHDFAVDEETCFMVMDYLTGETLQSRMKRLSAAGRPMAFSEAARICGQICEAAGYAHRHELVHRDIKPANIMLDVQGQAILMDFGIVKIIGGEYHTATGATIGTAMYMSPEQIRGEKVDARSDIYSLGVTLYEMVAGQAPFQADSAMTLMMMILNDPLPDIRKFREEIPEALVRILDKALAKDPADRFSTMQEMAEALQQIQSESDERSIAKTVADQNQAPPPPDERKMAEPEAPKAPAVERSQPVQGEAVSATAQSPQKAINVFFHPARQESDLKAPQEADGLKKTKRFQSLDRSQVRWLISGMLALAVVGAVLLVVLYFQPPRLDIAPVSLPETVLDAGNASSIVSLGQWNLNSFVAEMVISPDGILLATANNRDSVRWSQYRFYAGVWRIENGQLQSYLAGNTQWLSDISFSPDGKQLASVSDDGRIRFWQAGDGRLERTIESSNGGFTSLDFSPSGLLLTAGGWDGSVGLWQVDNGNLLRRMKNADYGIRDVAFSPDGMLIAAPSDDKDVLIWKVSDGTLAYRLEDFGAPVVRVAFSPDGSLLATASEDHTIGLWSLQDGRRLNVLRGHQDIVRDVVFSTDGSLLASVSDDGSLRLWQPADGQLLHTLQTEDSLICISMDPKGRFLAAGTPSGTVLFWGVSSLIP